MPIPGSGTVSINTIVQECGGSAPHAISEYYRGGPLVTPNNTDVPTSGTIPSRLGGSRPRCSRRHLCPPPMPPKLSSAHQYCDRHQPQRRPRGPGYCTSYHFRSVRMPRQLRCLHVCIVGCCCGFMSDKESLDMMKHQNKRRAMTQQQNCTTRASSIVALSP